MTTLCCTSAMLKIRLQQGLTCLKQGLELANTPV